MMENGYKETEIGLIPIDWKLRRVSEVANIKYGKQKPKSEGQYSVIGSSGVYAYTSDPLIDFPTLIIGRKGNAGTVQLALDPCWPADTTFYLEWLTNEINVQFLYHFMSAHKLSGEHAKTTLPSIQRQDLENYFFPTPTLDEQSKIVVLMNKIQKAIAQQEQIIAKTKELKRSLMQRLFTHGLRGEELKETEIGLMPKSWDLKKLEDFVSKTSQKDMTRSPSQQFKYIDVSSVSNESLKIIDYKIYKGDEAPSRARKIIKRDDVLVATVRPTLKRIAFVGNEFDEEICSTAFCVLRSSTDLSSRYLYFCAQRDSFIENLGKLQRGASYPAVTDGNIKDQLIPFPKDITEQNEIADILWRINEKIEQETNKQKSLKELFKTMLQLLMTGQVRVKDIDFGDIHV